MATIRIDPSGEGGKTDKIASLGVGSVNRLMNTKLLSLLGLLTVAAGWSLADPPTPAVPGGQAEDPLAAFRAAPRGALPPTPAKERLLGIAYSTWHHATPWENVWGTPTLGYYKSDDRTIIRRHAVELADAGVDFIWIDWSNDLGYTYDPGNKRPDFDMIEDATFAVFDEFSKLRGEGKKTPNISVFIGNPGAPEATADGRLSAKALQVWNQFAANPVYRPLLQGYLGKPLLVVYVNTPSPYQHGIPAWNDPRFTVRYMTGFPTEQPALLGPGLVSKYGYWSWEDRGPQTYSVFNGHPEAMTVVASWRADGAKPPSGRRNGDTFRREWERARQVGPRFALVVSWNEWSRGEQPEANASKDLEPSREFGTEYLDLLKEEAAKFKRGE